MSVPFGLKAGNSPGAGSFLNLINSLPPASANDGTVLPAVQTYDAVGRIVLGQTTAQGTNGSYVRIRASVGGAILNTATVGVGATSLTVINRGAGTAAQYTTQIEAWMELVVTAATVSMLSSATINDIGADNPANVFARFATPTSAAEAVTQRAYVFETNDPSLTFYEATPQTVYGAGTASCDGVATFYDIGGDSLPNFVFAGSTSPSDDGVISSSGSWRIKRNSNIKYFITSNAASPSLATGTWTVNSPAVAPAPTVLGVTYDVEVASRVQWNNGVKSYVALLTQTGTDAPVATVLENTLGGTVVWTYAAGGRYDGTLAGAFTANKTAVNSGSCVNAAGSTLNGWFAGNRTNADAVRLISSAANDPSSTADDVLVATLVEILVYP